MTEEQEKQEREDQSYDLPGAEENEKFDFEGEGLGGPREDVNDDTGGQGSPNP